MSITVLSRIILSRTELPRFVLSRFALYTLGVHCHIRPLLEVTIQLRTSAVIWTLFWCGYNCGPWQLYGQCLERRTSAVLWTLFLHSRPSHHKTADGGLYMDTFPTGFLPSRFGCSHNCGPRPLYGHFSYRVHITADLGSFVDTFRRSVTKLRTSAVLWTLFGPHTKVSI